MKQAGLKLTEPVYCEKSERVFEADGLYNPTLAMNLAEKGTGSCVANDFTFDEQGTVYILTGPNNGGKSVLLRTLYDFEDKDILRREIESSYLLTNATGMGMKPLEGQTWLPDTSYLRPDLIVTDTVYAPAKTKFLEMAEEVGCKKMNGLGMMLFQGAAGFKLWTGQDMPIEHMKEVLGIKYE